jgi:hypothetical protein
MKEQFITCPHCNKKFPLSEAMRHEIEEQVKSDHQRELEEIEAEHLRQIDSAKKEAAKQAEVKAKKELLVEVNDLKNQVKELEDKSEEFTKKELDFLKREREIGKKEKQIELDREAFITKKTEELQLSVREEVENELKGKLAEKDQKITRLEKIAEELQKKARQGSMEEQGEAFEQELENILKGCFPTDEFEPVPKGKRGADIVHRFKTESLKQCGTILWEAKNAENWSEGWIAKLKDDQRQIGGETIGIIVTKALPKTIKRFGFQDGVWISDFYSIIGLATAIRAKFQELHQAKSAIAGRSSLMDLIYNYITGSEFKSRIEAIGDAWKEMKSDIDKEKIVMEKIWAKREKQLFRISTNMAGVYGDLTGYGATLQKVQTLELEAGYGNDTTQ